MASNNPFSALLAESDTSVQKKKQSKPKAAKKAPAKKTTQKKKSVTKSGKGNNKGSFKASSQGGHKDSRRKTDKKRQAHGQGKRYDEKDRQSRNAQSKHSKKGGKGGKGTWLGKGDAQSKLEDETQQVEAADATTETGDEVVVEAAPDYLAWSEFTATGDAAAAALGDKLEELNLREANEGATGLQAATEITRAVIDDTGARGKKKRKSKLNKKKGKQVNLGFKVKSNEVPESDDYKPRYNKGPKKDFKKGGKKGGKKANKPKFDLDNDFPGLA